MPDIPAFAMVAMPDGSVRLDRLQAWPESMMLISVTGGTYYAADSSPVQPMPCAMCGQPVDRHPFAAYTLISNAPCLGSGDHIPSVTVPIHVGCDDGDNQKISDAIIAIFQHCGD